MVSVYEYAFFSADVYHSFYRKGPLDFWKMLFVDKLSADFNKIDKLGGTGDEYYYEAGDLGIAAYDNGSNEIIISIRGTELDDLGDIGADLLLGAGVITDELQQILEFYQRVVEENPDAKITFTGHSLGGGLASMAAEFIRANARTGFTADATVSAVVFDPAPSKTATINALDNYELSVDGSLVLKDGSTGEFGDPVPEPSTLPGVTTNYTVSGEAVSEYFSFLGFTADPNLVTLENSGEFDKKQGTVYRFQ